MFKVNVVTVGKVKEKYFVQAIEEYAKRLTRFCEFNLYECKEQSLEDVQPSVALLRESEEILKRLKGYVVVMAIEGKKLSSEQLAKKLTQIKDSVGEVTFVIGSSCGISDKVKQRADELISFSDMTFPHTLFKVMLCEQIYRACMINGGGQYHK
ncbi:MAG: 23S rRNA (pseudouridine(1915)-N(3))-methyltransferase RlmH [Clostridia bacterium]|nr:23S rRNA (pseudouridine(1915)-N(3))-methyltransferase RlmH [Clostridia bacterium]